MLEKDIPPEVIQRQLSQFSKLQLEILYLKCQRKKNIEIGNQLGYAPSTIADYVGDIYQKLDFDPKWHWTECREHLEKHYCETITAIHEGKLPVQPVPDPTPPQPSPAWLTVVEQEDHEQAGEETRVPPNPTPPPRGSMSRSRRMDLPRWIEFGLVVITCAFAIWAIARVFPNPLVQPAAPLPTTAGMGLVPQTGNDTAAQPTDGDHPTAASATQPPSASIWTGSLVRTPAPTTQPSALPERILYASDFDTYPGDIVQSGDAYAVNGQLVAQTDVQLVIGEETWTNYVVSFQMTEVACKEWQTSDYYFNRPIVGLRLKNKRMVGIMLCTDLIYFATNDPDSADQLSTRWTPIPYSSTDGASGPYEVQVTGNTFRFGDQQISVDGYPEGKVFLRIPEGVAIRNLVIKALP